MFERTPYKETFYLWRLVAPLNRATLDYSTRVPKGAYVHLSKESPRELAAAIAKIVSENIPYLESIQAPRDFLDHISWMIGNDSPLFLFDLAVTYFLVGRYHEALLALRETSMEAERTILGFKRSSDSDSPVIVKMDQLRRTADDFAAAVQSNPSAATEIVRDWERKNIALLDLANTMLEAITSPPALAARHDPSSGAPRTRVAPPPQPPKGNSKRARK